MNVEVIAERQETSPVHEHKDFVYVFGIDPGVQTGLSIIRWSTKINSIKLVAFKSIRTESECTEDRIRFILRTLRNSLLVLPQEARKVAFVETPGEFLFGSNVNRIGPVLKLTAMSWSVFSFFIENDIPTFPLKPGTWYDSSFDKNENTKNAFKKWSLHQAEIILKNVFALRIGSLQKNMQDAADSLNIASYALNKIRKNEIQI